MPYPRDTTSRGGDADALALSKKMLAEYQAPALDPAVDEALGEFIAKKKASMPDAFVRARRIATALALQRLGRSAITGGALATLRRDGRAA